MPSFPTKGVLTWTLDLMVGVAERAIELIGDPDLRESIERDRRALRASHNHLVETLREIDELQAENAQLRTWHVRDAEEIGRLRVIIGDRLKEIDGLKSLRRSPERHDA